MAPMRREFILGGTSWHAALLCWFYVHLILLRRALAFRRCRGVVEAEQSSPIKLEAIIKRAQGGGGIRAGELPSACDVLPVKI